jgi:hypothetical protein
MPGIWDTYNQTPTSQNSSSSAFDIWGTYADQVQQAAQTQADLNQPAWYEQALAAIKQGGGAVLGALGTVLRPLSAPQQVLFGVLQGDPLKGLRTATNDVTSWFAKPFTDERITGADLVQSAASSLKVKGMPDAVSKWGGLALDLLADPALIASAGAGAAAKLSASARVTGQLGKAATLGRVENTLKIGSEVLGSPLKVAFQALPKVSREALAQKAYTSLLGREIGADGAFIPKQTVGSFLIPSDLRQRIYPEQVAKFEKMKQDAAMVGRAAGNMISERVQGLEKAYDSVLAKVPVANKQAFSEKLNEFVTFKNPNDAARTWQDLVDMGNAHGVDPQQLWSVLQHTTRVNTLSTGVMAGSSRFLNDLMFSRLGVDEQTIQGVARIAPETARLRLGIPEAGLQTGNAAFDNFGNIARAEAQQVLTSVPVVNAAELLSGVSVRRGLHREFQVLGMDGEAHIARVDALKRPAGLLSDRAQLIKTIENAANELPVQGIIQGPVPPGFRQMQQNNNVVALEAQAVNKARMATFKTEQNDKMGLLAFLMAQPEWTISNQRVGQVVTNAAKPNAALPAAFGIDPFIGALGNDILNPIKPELVQAAQFSLNNRKVVNRLTESRDAFVKQQSREIVQNSYDTAFKSAVQASASDIADEMIAVSADGSKNLLDALSHVQNKFSLDPNRMKNLIEHIAGAANPGFERIPSSNEAAKFLRQFRAEAQVGPRGIPGGTGAAGAAKQRNDALTASMLADLGEVKDVLANAYRDASITGHEAAFQAKILGTKQFLEENGLYIKPMSDLPVGVNINAGGNWAAPGHTTVTAAMSQASNGVLETGAVIPDFVAREFQIATTMKGAAGSGVLQKVLSRWQVLKLSNPPTIVQNVISNMVQAATYAPKALSPADLLAGLKTRVTETAAMKEARLSSGLGSWSEDMMGLRNKTDEAKRAMLGVKASSLENAQAYFDDLIGAHLKKEGTALVPRVGDVLTLGATYIGRNLFQFYKATEDRMRDAAFYAFLKKGMSMAEAADHATQIFFDYSSRPGLVDATAKLGIPFQTYPNLAGWRTLSTLYDKPTYLRAQTQSRDNFAKGTNDPHELKAAEGWVANTMPIRIGQDSNGRGIYVPISQFLPMGATAAIADNVNNSLLGPIPMPPLLGLGLAVFGNTGFRGAETYKGLGNGAAEAFQNDPAETTRLALKELYKFGVYPWAPGTPVFERLTKAIMANGKTLQQLEDANQLPQGSLESFAARVGVNGPLLWGAGVDPVGVTNPLIQRPSDLTPALARVLGLRNYEVQGDVNQPGAARSAVTGAQRLVANKKTYWKQRILNAPKYARDSMIKAAMADLQKLGENTQQLYQELTQ